MEKVNLHQLHELILSACESAGLNVDDHDIHIERTKTLEHGHFATNVAMILCKKAKLSPQEAARKIISKLDSPLIEKAEIAGPGFINLFLEQKFYSKELASELRDLDDYLLHYLKTRRNEKTMVIEYSSPNIAKPLGVHHLLSTIIGDALKKIYKKAGYKVISDNYLGDLGTQFGKLMYAIHEWGDIGQIEEDPINELLRLYVKFHEEAEKDPSLEDKGRAEYKKFEESDGASRSLWRKIIKWSMEEINPLYKRLGVSFDYMNGESFYEDRLKPLLEDGRAKGVFVDGNDGAWIAPMSDPNDPPAIVRKKDGTTLYLTRDLAQVAYYEKTFEPDLMVWVVDVAQSLHFRQRFEVSRKLKQTDAELVHVSFGRMQFKDGAMSTRKGNIIRLSELLDEAEDRALKLVKEKASQLSQKEQKELARILGIGSVKYNTLQQNRISNITFDWDVMLSFDGNSAPYLLYTVTRAKSVLRKSEMPVSKIEKADLKLTSSLEIQIARQLLLYPEAFRRAQEEFKPNHIANYLYELAQDYNALYNDSPILSAPDETLKNSRLLLTLATSKIMEEGLTILGIEVPEKM